MTAAKLITTSRLHAALPAAAFGTLVIFVHKNLNLPGFKGLIDLVSHVSLAEFKHNKIDWENPPQNPNQKKLKDLRQDLIRKCINFIRDP